MSEPLTAEHLQGTRQASAHGTPPIGRPAVCASLPSLGLHADARRRLCPFSATRTPHGTPRGTPTPRELRPERCRARPTSPTQRPPAFPCTHLASPRRMQPAACAAQTRRPPARRRPRRSLARGACPCRAAKGGGAPGRTRLCGLVCLDPLTARLQKMQNPTGAACAAAPRSLQTPARAWSLRAASGRSLKTLGQNFSS